eukprot:6477003-Amphidinium_carterae.2
MASDAGHGLSGIASPSVRSQPQVEDMSGRLHQPWCEERRVIKSRTQLDMSPSARESREWENATCRAGLRDAARSVLSNEVLKRLMSRIRLVLTGALKEHPQLQGLWQRLGSPSNDPTYEPLVRRTRHAIADALGLDAEKSEQQHPYSPWKGRLLAELALQGQDDTIAASWLVEGAPIGIARPIPAGGFFPQSVQEREKGENELEHSALSNHPSFYHSFGDGDSPGQEQIADMIVRGFVELFPDRRAAEEQVGPLVVCPLGNLRRVKQGKVKDRLISDLRLANQLAARQERVVLPRPVDHAVALSRMLTQWGSMHSFVLDFADAYHSIPLHSEERRFCAAEVPEGLVVWRVVGFGGREFPLVFSRVISIVMRLTQAMFGPEELQLNCFMDDPAGALCPSKAKIVVNVAILFWLVLGAPLSWKKGRMGEGEHHWIGVTFKPGCDGCVQMSLPDEYLEVVREDLKKFVGATGHESLACARRLTGRCARIAQIVPQATPFSSALWAALAAAQAAEREAPPGRVACRRFGDAAKWFLALIDGRVLPLQRRVFPCYPHWPEDDGAGRSSVTDASPWGAGGLLYHRNQIVGYWSYAWRASEMDPLGLVIGDSAGQAVFEALGALIGIRVSLKFWFSKWPVPASSPLFVLGDNVAILNTISRMKGKGMLLRIAREIALIQAWSELALRVEHLPASDNELADALSRLQAQPSKPLPAELAKVPRVVPPFLHELFSIA